MMDVDLLRPGTVPISPDTVLWFEFLLNPSLLKKHISKHLPDPSPTDLMIKFMSINSDSRDTEIKIIDFESSESKINNNKKYSHKSIALKILSLKIGAYFKWDLDILEIKLPLPMQLTFLQDLFYITGDFLIELPGRPEFDIATVSDQFLFTLVLYHRWHIRAIVNKALNNKQSKPQFIHIPGIQEPTYVAPALVDDIMRKIEANVQHSVQVLNAVIQLTDIKPKMLTFDTFQILTEDSSEIKQNWENMQNISVEEFKCQIHYDLATIYLLREEYDIAKYHITQARDLFNKLASIQTEMSYCRVKKEVLDGYCRATNVAIIGVELSLTQQLHNSIKNNYARILEILKADNIAREIPMIYRDNLELDIEGGVANNKIVVPRDLLLNIQCLNLVRKILDNVIVQGNYLTEIKSKPVSLNILFPAIDSVLKSSSVADKQRIARYLLYLLTMTDAIEISKRILENESFKSLFDAEQLEEIRTHAAPEVTELPALLLNNDWGVSLTTYNQSKKFHIFELERQLIHSYDPVEIRDLLIRLDRQSSMNPPSRAKSRWEIPIPLQSVVSALPRGLYQDYAFILLAKSRELTSAKNLRDAKALLNAIEDEIQVHVATQNPNLINLSYKLSKMISWELILVEILQYYNSWNANLTVNSTVEDCNLKELVDKCKQCLVSVRETDQAIPRQEIIEYCVVFLLNMGEWDYFCGLDKRWNQCDFAAAISSVCKEVVKLKLMNLNARKFPREAWDLLLITFGPTRDLPQKRSNSSGNIGSSSTISISGSGGTKDVMNNTITGTLLRLREPTALEVAISLLARIHNVLRDESSLELYAQHLTGWPASISNANSYNIRTISEFLLHLLTQALKCYPTNVHFLRVMGDLNFILGYHESAMKYYLEVIMVESKLFSQRVPGQSMYARMIKCCAHLQCYTQATVLCQLLEEPKESHYSLAFKMASSDQKSCASTDAMDAYYHCIWDTTILEFLIHLHSKRGEHHRKQLAIKVIGLLELNSNNNEEIQREAANIRKTRFFRALAKQYVY